jgi:hypothetical protein
VLTECARGYAARGSAKRGKRTSKTRIDDTDAERDLPNDANEAIRKALRTTLPTHSLAGDNSGLPQAADAHYASDRHNVKSASNIFCAFAASFAIAIRFRGCLEIEKNDGVYCGFRNLHSSKYRKNKCEHKLRSIFFSAPAARIMCVCSTIPYVEPARAHAKNSYHSRHIRWRVLANRHRVRNIQRGDSGRVCTISPRMS